VRVLVTGSQGYIGCLLGPYLVERGHEVVGVDAGFYRESSLYDDTPLTVETLTRDIRQLAEADFDGIDAVVHMAELSNDPLGQLLPTITHEINHRGSVHVAATAKAAGVTRFVYTSSCSVYGAATSDLVDEESPLAPQTAYAECKQLVERDVGVLGDDDFSPTFLRNATAYGASPRMRFDIVLNNLCGLAWTTGEIRMESDGTPWRPLVHALDICASIGCVLEAPRDQVYGQILNVGAPEANFQVREVAEIVGRVFPDCQVTVGERGADRRSYRVSFAKIQELLPAFRCSWDPESGARQLLEVFSRVELTHDDFVSRKFTRLKQMEHLLATRQIDESFLWTPMAPRQPGVRAR
jgi:nucleoside-diphosphate-sugar epimerase